LGGQVRVRLAGASVLGKRLVHEVGGRGRRLGVLPLQGGHPAPDQELGQSEEEQQQRVEENHGSSLPKSVTALASRNGVRPAREKFGAWVPQAIASTVTAYIERSNAPQVRGGRRELKTEIPYCRLAGSRRRPCHAPRSPPAPRKRKSTSLGQRRSY